MSLDIISRNDADVVGVRNGCTFTGWTGRYWVKKMCTVLNTCKCVGCTKDKKALTSTEKILSDLVYLS